MGKNKQLAVNMIAQLIAFVVNIGISFSLTPFIVANVGREAYGFVSLGGNFVGYAALLSTTLNSMAGRFISLSINRNKFDDANHYYSSVFFADIILAVTLSIPSIYIVLNIGRLVTIPERIFSDVQLLWALLFINFLIGVISSVFGVGLFAANRIDIQSKRNIGAYLIRAGLLLFFYIHFEPKVYYIGVVSIVCTLYTAIANHYSGRILYPELRFSKYNVAWRNIKELLSSGVWNSVSRVGAIALTELDLLLSNLFISAEAMGTLSIAKVVPNHVSSFVSTIVSVLLPQLTVDYAKNSKEKFIQSIKSYMRMLLFFQSVIYGVLFGFFDVFLKLWLPGTADTEYIYLLAMITISGCFVSSVSYIMINIFTVTNKLRFSSIAIVVTGIISFAVTYLLLKTTNLGLIAISGTSVFLVVLRNIVILLPYGAKCVDSPWYTFFPDLGLNIIIVFMSIVVCTIIKIALIHTLSWLYLFMAVVLAVITVLTINYYLLLKKEERSIIEKRVKKILRRI